MELKEYVNIFRKNARAFVITILVVVVAGLLFNFLRPLNYNSILTLNITRIGIQQTPDYRYDDFYRLQADEKFSDTVVRWLSSPRIATDILNDSKITTSGLSVWSISRFFKAERLSSQVIQVSYVANNSTTAQNISQSVLKIINTETEKLNQDQKEASWFKVLGGNPVVKENKFNWGITFLAALLLGIFFGIWVVMIKHYLE
jgi:capsular polysaccharide biosynthesis protein